MSRQVNKLIAKYKLTVRQAQFAILASQGVANKQIADIHGVAVSTVKDNLTTVYAATGTKKRTDLVKLLAEL